MASEAKVSDEDEKMRLLQKIKDNKKLNASFGLKAQPEIQICSP